MTLKVVQAALGVHTHAPSGCPGFGATRCRLFMARGTRWTQQNSLLLPVQDAPRLQMGRLYWVVQRFCQSLVLLWFTQTKGVSRCEKGRLFS